MSLIIKIGQNGSSKEYLFDSLGPITIGSDKRSDLWLDDPRLDPKLLEIKVSGGNVFIKEIGARSQIYLDSVILPYRQEVSYNEGECISFKDSNYQINILKTTTDASEPPPFFLGDFKERLDQVNAKIYEKESDLKQLITNHDKKNTQLIALEGRFQKFSINKSRIEVEVKSLESQKEVILLDLRRSKDQKEHEEAKIIELRDYVKRLENEERALKDTIIAQNMVLNNIKEEKLNKDKEVDLQRALLVNLQLDTSHLQEKIEHLTLEQINQEQELQLESTKIKGILNSSDAAVRESHRLQIHLANLIKEKAMLDHDVKGLQSELEKMGDARKMISLTLQEINQSIDLRESEFLKIQEKIQLHEENESNLKKLNIELRTELIKAEERLGVKKNLLNQLDFQGQDAARKLTTVVFELERAGQRLIELKSEEKSHELKMLALRDDLQQVIKRNVDEKKIFQKKFNEEKSKLGLELHELNGEMESARKVLSQLDSDKGLVQAELDELRLNHRLLAKERLQLEYQVNELSAKKVLAENQIQTLKSDTSAFEHEKNRSQRELTQLQIKIMDCETLIKQRHEESRLELENLKREERAKIAAEKCVSLSEIEAFKIQSLNAVETEFRKKQDLIQNEKISSQEYADAIIKEARLTEVQITSEANARLKQATLEAHERELQSHHRVKEAQDYFKTKEIEADAIIKKSQMESHALLQRSEQDLLEDFSRRKEKMKNFLYMKQSSGLAHIQLSKEQHHARMKKEEEKGLQQLEDIKRKELKKVVALRDLEASKLTQMKEDVLNELKAEKSKVFHQLNELKNSQETELSEKRKTVLESIHSTKFHQQKSWQEELARDKDLFLLSKKERIKNATQAVMNVLIAETGAQGEKEQILKEKIQSTLSMAIDGQNAQAMKEVDQILDFNPMKRKKIIPVLREYSRRIGVPAAVAIILLADVASIRSRIVAASQDLIKQRTSASEIYVHQQKNEWKQKHTFNPTLTVGYKATYAENVLYTKDFEKVMENEEFQNDWILKVHDFMVKDLELSEDIAINYISTEGALLKELALARKDVHPQFLEIGIKKLTAIEKSHLGWINGKIPDPIKMEKFLQFRKDFFNNFYQEKFVHSRGIANDAKP